MLEWDRNLTRYPLVGPSRVEIVERVPVEDALQVALSESDYVIEAFASHDSESFTMPAKDPLGLQ
jgi:hypothetical protein